MADILETLAVRITADISQLQEGLKGASGQLKDIGVQLTAGLTLPIIGFGIAAVKAFSDSQTELTQLNAVLRSTKGVAGVTAKAADDLAKSFQRTTRFSDEAVLSVENMLLTFTSIKKDVFPQATETVLNMATALGEDTKSAAIQLGKALNDPITGVTALRRVGVQFTESQKKQIEAMVKSGNLMGAQKLILKELQTEFGGSAKAAGDTFAGSLDKLKNKFDDLLETIGGKLAPTLTKGIDFLSGLIDKIAALPPDVLNIALAIAAIAAAAGPVLTILGSLGALIGIVFSPAALIILGIIAVLKVASDHFGGLGNMIKAASDAASKLIKIVGFEMFDTLTKASTAAKELGQIVGLVLFDNLNKAAIAAGQLWFIVQFGVLKVLNDAYVAAKQLAELALLTLFDWLNRAATAAGQLAQMVGLVLAGAIDWVKARFDDVTKSAHEFINTLNEALFVIQHLQDIISGANSTSSTPLSGGVSINGQSITPPHSNGSGGRRSAFTQFEEGGPTGQGGLAMTHPDEFVVPHGGALVSGGGGYRGPSMLHIILQAENFADHLYINIADTLAGSRS